MSDIDKRLERLEARAGADAETVGVVFLRDDDTSSEAAWARENPGEPLPGHLIAIRFVGPMPDGPHGRA